MGRTAWQGSGGVTAENINSSFHLGLQINWVNLVLGAQVQKPHPGRLRAEKVLQVSVLQEARGVPGCQAPQLHAHNPLFTGPGAQGTQRATTVGLGMQSQQRPGEISTVKLVKRITLGSCVHSQ